MNMELDDLPPRYRAQAEQQLAARKRRAADPLAEAVKQAKAAGRNFDSRGEYEFYTGTVLPKMARGEIVECEQHPAASQNGLYQRSFCGGCDAHFNTCLMKLCEEFGCVRL